MSYGEGVSAISENVRGSPNERLVASTTTKHEKRHSLTLAWPEESGQCLSIGRGSTPVTVLQRFTTDMPARAIPPSNSLVSRGDRPDPHICRHRRSNSCRRPQPPWLAFEQRASAGETSVSRVDQCGHWPFDKQRQNLSGFVCRLRLSRHCLERPVLGYLAWLMQVLWL